MSPLPSLSTCVKLTMNGAAADLANKSPDGTALFQIASHCSGFRAAEGRPDVMVFAWASAQVADIGTTIMERRDALNILSSPGSCQVHPTAPLSGGSMRRKGRPPLPTRCPARLTPDRAPRRVCPRHQLVTQYATFILYG